MLRLCLSDEEQQRAISGHRQDSALLAAEAVEPLRGYLSGRYRLSAFPSDASESKLFSACVTHLSRKIIVGTSPARSPFIVESNGPPIGRTPLSTPRENARGTAAVS